MNLYTINETLNAMLEMIGERLLEGQEPTEAEREAVFSLQGDLPEKLADCGKYVKNATADSEALKAEIERLTARKRAIDNRAEWLKASMLSVMQEHNIERIDDLVMPLRLQNSPDSVVIKDLDLIPEEYTKVKIEANKTAIAKALKAGAVIDGAVLETKQHLRIG